MTDRCEICGNPVSEHRDGLKCCRKCKSDENIRWCKNDATGDRMVACACSGNDEVCIAEDTWNTRAVRSPEPTAFKLNWTPDTPPNDECCYTHCRAETPFGPVLITWKGWKDEPYASVDECPFPCDLWGTPAEAREDVEQMFAEKLAECGVAPKPEPPADMREAFEAEMRSRYIAERLWTELYPIWQGACEWMAAKGDQTND